MYLLNEQNVRSNWCYSCSDHYVCTDAPACWLCVILWLQSAVECFTLQWP